jgi:GNAT superfamily N-acetyltransferase
VGKVISFKPSPPELLTGEHVLDSFECGEPSLDDWLKRRALRNQASDASRCFVICEERTVVGYYCLSAGGIGRGEAPKRLQRNMPERLPVLLLGRLAIDRRYHNLGLGSALLRDAMLRAVHIAGDTGVFALLVHALSEPAKQFYLSRGFVQSPLQPMTLFMTLATVRTILSEPN